VDAKSRAVGDTTYFVYREGDTVFVWDCVNHEEKTRGTDATTVIQYALDNLTPGRTEPEKVVISGIYTGMDSMMIRSHTVVEVCGSLTAKSTQHGGCVLGMDSADAAHDIEIFGGVVDANGDTLPFAWPEHGGNGITIFNASDVYVHDMTIYGGDLVSPYWPGGQGVYVRKSHDILLSNLTVDSARYNGILIDWGSYHCIVNCCSVMSVFQGGYDMQGGIQLAYDTHDCQIVNCCVVADRYALAIQHTATNHVVANNLCIGNTSLNQSWGIRFGVGGDNDNKVTGNRFVNFRIGVLARYAAQKALRNEVSYNEFYNCLRGVDMELYSADSFLVANNFFNLDGADAEAYLQVGTGNTGNRFIGNVANFSVTVWDSGTGTVFSETGSPGSIEGTVTLGGGSGEIMDAIVYVGEDLCHVAANGHYVISPLYLGEHVVTAALDGYALGSQVVTLADGENRLGVDITLDTLWDFEASGYSMDNQGTGWEWGTDAVAGYHSATNVWGTTLGADYTNCGDYRLILPPVCLSHLDSVKLIFWHWHDIEPNGGTQAYDGANVAVAPYEYGPQDWQVVQPFGGYPGSAGYDCNPIQTEPAFAGASGGWVQDTFDLTPFVGQTVSIRFRLGTDVGVTHRGWYIDDVALLAWHSIPGPPPEPVNDLTIFPDGEDVVLAWSAMPGATTYRVYRSTSAGQPVELMELLSEQTGTGYTDDSLSALKTAFYVVTSGN